MGIDYSGSVGIGYILSFDEFRKPFLRNVGEKAHYEDRYHPKTGQKLLPEKVIDVEAGEVLVFKGDDYGDCGDYELCEALGKELECNVSLGGWMGGGTEHQLFYFEPYFKTEEFGSFDVGHVDVGGSIPFGQVLEQKDELVRLAKDMKKLGLDPGRARVFVNFHYG